MSDPSHNFWRRVKTAQTSLQDTGLFWQRRHSYWKLFKGPEALFKRCGYWSQFKTPVIFWIMSAEILMFRNRFGWHTSSQLSKAYLFNGSLEALKLLEVRLARNTHLVNRLWLNSLGDKSSMLLFAVFIGFGASASLLEHPNPSEDWRKRLQQFQVGTLKRSRILIQILLRAGADPTVEVDDRGNTLLSWMDDLYEHSSFIREVSVMIVESDAYKRGAHLDAVLPPVGAPEVAPAPKRARL